MMHPFSRPFTLLFLLALTVRTCTLLPVARAAPLPEGVQPPQEWAMDARRAALNAPDYANRIDDIANQVRRQCRFKPGRRFVWLSRITPEGIPMFSLMVHNDEPNRRAECFIKIIKTLKLPPPPGNEVYGPVGGFPVAWESSKP